MKIKKFFEAVEGAFQKMPHAEAAGFRRKYTQEGETIPFTSSEEEQITRSFVKYTDVNEETAEKTKGGSELKLSKKVKSGLVGKPTIYDIVISKLKDDWYFVTLVGFHRVGESSTSYWGCNGFDELMNGLNIVKKEMK